MSKIIIIDSYGFFYRAHYAFFKNPLKNQKGQVTSVVYAFLNILFRLFKERDFTKIICTLDSKGPSFRKKLYNDYKANRPPMPDDLKEQIDIIKKILSYLGIPTVAKTSYEADDIIASYALSAPKSDQIAIFSSDKDLLQLVNDHVTVLTNDRKTNLFLELNRDKVIEKMKVAPGQIADYLALLGDTADNIPGVAGVGKVTAEKLIKEFDSLENLYENLTEKELSPTIKKKLSAGKDSAFLSKKLILLNSIIPGLPSLEEINFSPVQIRDLLKILEELEFNSLKKKFLAFEANQEKLTIKEILSDDANQKKPESIKKTSWENPFTRKEISLKELSSVIEKIKQEKIFTFDLETTSLNPFEAKIVAIVFAFKDQQSFYLRIMEETQGQENQDTFLNNFKPILEDEQIKKIGHNLKFEYLILKAKGIHLKGISFDTMIAEYFLDPDKNHFNLEDMIFHYFQYQKIKFKELIKNQDSIFTIEKEALKNYTYEDGEFTFLIYQEQKKKLTEAQLELFNNVDIPFIEVLGDMEIRGVLIDEKVLQSLQENLSKKIVQEEKRIYALVGEEFNINSTKQLQKILFEKLAIKPIKKMKTGFSTDNYVLEKLAPNYVIATFILNYRKFNKLLSTYVLALPKLISPITGRVHTSYNQAVAATGRLSSNNPNLQNIPIGKESAGIRKAFIAPHGFTLVSIDYSQVELRILAWLAKDESFLEAYQKKIDIHQKTASLLFGKNVEEIGLEERTIAKTINFSVIYGISAHALSEDLKVSYQEANEFIKIFFASYPKVKTYQEKILTFARENGFVETYYKRKRWVKDILSSQFFVKARAERIAFNSVIQGTASDIIKKAMLNLQEKIKANTISAQMVMQVHDELVFYIAENEVEENVDKITKTLTNIKPFHEILEVNVMKGKNWEK